MAKALFGHVGGPDHRMVSEMRRLQQRVRDLEAELVRLQEQNDALAVEAEREDVLVRGTRARVRLTSAARPGHNENQSGAPFTGVPLRCTSALDMPPGTRVMQAHH